jgi:hypothetical protein
MPPIVNVKKDRILECVRAPEPELELWRAGQRAGKLIDKLVEPLLIDLIGSFRIVANKSKFLQGNVEEVIGIWANDGKGRERPPDLVKRRFQRCRRYSHDANGVDALTSTPLSSVVASIGNRVMRTERLPHATIGGILPPGRLKVTPTLAEQVNVSRTSDSGCGWHPESGAKARSL